MKEALAPLPTDEAELAEDGMAGQHAPSLPQGETAVFSGIEGALGDGMDSVAANDAVFVPAETNLVHESTLAEDAHRRAVDEAHAEDELRTEARAAGAYAEAQDRARERAQNNSREIDAAHGNALAEDVRRPVSGEAVVEPPEEVPLEVRKEEAALESAVSELSPAEREEVGWKLYNVGFQLEKAKSEGFAKVYEKLAGQFDEQSTMGRFFGAMRTQFTEKAATTKKQIDDIEASRKDGKTEGLLKQIGNAGYLSGNLLKYGRIVADAAGWTAGAPTRWVTLGAMATGSVLEGTKEARLANEEVKERTRVADIDKAADEAWAIYEGAMKNKGLDPDGDHEGVSKEELVKAYQEKLPADILRRLTEEPKEGTGSSLVQKMFQKHIGWAAGRIEKKLEAVDGDASLDAKTKAEKKEAIIQRFGRSKMLGDFDRMLSQEGAVDTLAMSARYGEQGAKGIVYGMMADSLYRLWDHFGSAFSGKSWDMLDIIPSASAATVAENVMTPEELALQQESARAVLEGDMPQVKHDVVRGDTLWKIAKGNPAVLRLTPDELRSIGVSSGNPNLIKVGETVDVDRLDEFLRQKGELAAELKRIAPGAIVERTVPLPPAEIATEAVPERPPIATVDLTKETPQVPDQAAESEKARMALEEQFESERQQTILEEERLRPRGQIPPARVHNTPFELAPARSPVSGEIESGIRIGTERFPSGRGFHLEGDSIVPDRRLSELAPRELARWPTGTPKPWPVTLAEADRSFGGRLNLNRQLAEDFRFKAGRYPNEDEFKVFSKFGARGGNAEQQFFGTVRSGPLSRMQAEEYERMMRGNMRNMPYDARGGRPRVGYPIGEGRGGRSNNPFEVIGARPPTQSEILEQRARDIWLEEKTRGNPNADAHYRRGVEQAERMRIRETQIMRGRMEHDRNRAGANIAKQILGSILHGRR
ncbi:MAG: hypothetical protein A3C93_00555 [Candidatus Lloydbacteria bacterium RIFCSPHIGHO2_02_FULL_54_17]|uniref:LysM domain-containing protein n=1 Tax=Candidatus Lloydbacteria bacterium RIFCSPHIGHO2_02_FULL_54_17 TaxID=1798664 RepID=A0A1G2DB81_9BACT|nr:MAG: hypothetical protein A2762_02645 [Candidatus Lloydbacteria bacterium RIFCSPHIGHO2_01_FULL_54_11]OGZ10887.1 MAG: hypothetical protein A3C93_00555 [Candidatus Lloydbacteria bacterium RIFCSPHIGHO2_02_FULL_54_17]